MVPLVWKVLKVFDTVFFSMNIFGRGPMGDMGTSELEIRDHGI